MPLRNLHHSLWRSAGDHDAALGLTEKDCSIGETVETRQIHFCPAQAIDVRDAALGESDREPAIAAIVRGAHRARLNRFEQSVDDRLLARGIAARRSADYFTMNRRQILAPAQLT